MTFWKVLMGENETKKKKKKEDSIDEYLCNFYAIVLLYIRNLKGKLNGTIRGKSTLALIVRMSKIYVVQNS